MLLETSSGRRDIIRSLHWISMALLLYITVPNAFNTEDFNIALENFIAPSIGRFALGEPCSVVVMDDCRIQDSDETINITCQNGGIAVFLPYVFCFVCYIYCQQSHLWNLSDY